jgi:DNA sulfur modification protein DndB
MARPKPPDEQLEDEVWCILAQMVFSEMSKGRRFQRAVEDGLPARQVDVFAKDDETVVIVECTM